MENSESRFNFPQPQLRHVPWLELFYRAVEADRISPAGCTPLPNMTGAFPARLCRDPDGSRISRSSRSTSREKLCLTAERAMTTLQEWRKSVTTPFTPSNTPLFTRTGVPTATFGCGSKKHPFARASRILSNSSLVTTSLCESPSRRITPGTEITEILLCGEKRTKTYPKNSGRSSITERSVQRERSR